MNRRNFFRVLGVGALAVPTIAAKATEPVDEPRIITRIYSLAGTEGNTALHIPDHTHSLSMHTHEITISDHTHPLPDVTRDTYGAK